MTQVAEVTHMREPELMDMLNGKSSVLSADNFSVLAERLDVPTSIYFGDTMMLAMSTGTLSALFDRCRKNFLAQGYVSKQIEVLSCDFVRADQVHIDLNWVIVDRGGARQLKLRAQYFCARSARGGWRISMVAFQDRLEGPLAAGLPIQ